MGERILTNVERVHFHENDKNSPEDLCLPSCLTSLAGSIGRDIGIRITEDGWRQRQLYFDLLAWTGMGFGLLWYPGGCPSCTDLSQVNDSHDQTIERGFAGIGCRADIIENNAETAALIKQRLVESIDTGFPVLAFGLVEPPECGIVCGYRKDGGELLGWDFFQKEFPCEQHDNGMLLLRDWSKVWKFVFLKEKGAPVDLRSSERMQQCLEHGIRIMTKTSVENYLAGQAAYEAWKTYVLADAVPPEEIRRRHFLHHILVGNLAEARAYTCFYLGGKPDLPPDAPAAERAGDKFMIIHNTCWKIWNVLGDYGAPMEILAEKFIDPDNRRKIAEHIDEMAQLDREALHLLKQAVGQA